MSEVDGKPLTAPWMCLLAATDTSILPPQLSFALDRAPSDNGAPEGAVLALVGPERAMGSAFLALQGSKEFSVHVKAEQDKARKLLFTTPLRGVIRLDRDELNRWLMDQTGSVSYVPYIGVILLMPHDPKVIERFDAVATGIVPLDVLGQGETDRGHLQLAEYEPEVVYLAKLQRDRLISGWDIAGSLDRVIAVNNAVNEAAIRVSKRAENDHRATSCCWSTIRRIRRGARRRRATTGNSWSTARPRCCWAGWRTSRGSSACCRCWSRCRCSGWPGCSAPTSPGC